MTYKYDIRQYHSPRRLVDPNTLKLLDQWKTVEGFDLWLPSGDHIHVPKNFRYDKASVPRLVWWYLPRDDRSVAVAALIHDYLYVTQKIGSEWILRGTADDIFYDLLRHAGMRWTKAKAAWLGVRAGGWASYNPRAKKLGNSHYQ